jgi:hypothetical protein
MSDLESQDEEPGVCRGNIYIRLRWRPKTVSVPTVLEDAPRACAGGEVGEEVIARFYFAELLACTPVNKI